MATRLSFSGQRLLILMRFWNSHNTVVSHLLPSVFQHFAMKTTISLACFSFLFFKEILTQKLKGFHFNKGRNQLWSLPSDELKQNESWFFDFEKHGNCLRLDVAPFKLPRKFTVCYKQNHDYSDVFTVLSLLSTKTGGSVIEELENNL